MTEARQGELNLTVQVATTDGAANTGKFLMEVSRGLANRLTTLVMENHGVYLVNFDIKIQEVSK